MQGDAVILQAFAKRYPLRTYRFASLTLGLFIVMAVHLGVPAQGGGKAEANRVRFPRGSSSTILIGTLSHDEEMEFLFTARKGQKAMLRNANPSLFDLRVFSDEFGLETAFGSSRTFTVDLPQKGDYLLYVRRKPGGPDQAKFSVTLALR